MEEMHDMFMDMAMLVELQGEKIDRIGYDFEEVLDYVQASTQHTKKALKYQSKGRRKRFFLGICLFIVVLLIVTVIIVLDL